MIRRPSGRDARGVTLLELVVVLAVLATVTALAIPSIRRGRPSAFSQLRVKLRYQLIPPVKPVRLKASTNTASSSDDRNWF